MNVQRVGRPIPDINSIAPLFPVTSGDHRIFTSRELYINQRAGLIQSKDRMSLCVLNDHVLIRQVFIFPTDREAHMQVVTRGLLNKPRFIQTNAS